MVVRSPQRRYRAPVLVSGRSHPSGGWHPVFGREKQPAQKRVEVLVIREPKAGRLYRMGSPPLRAGSRTGRCCGAPGEVVGSCYAAPNHRSTGGVVARWLLALSPRAREVVLASRWWSPGAFEHARSMRRRTVSFGLCNSPVRVVSKRTGELTNVKTSGTLFGVPILS